MKTTTDSFAKSLHNYLTVFLPKQRGCSKHTVLAAKQVWNILLNHICAATAKNVENITFGDFSYSSVIGFLDAKENERGWTPKTRNHRLGVIRSFFGYVVAIEPVKAHYLEVLKKIPLKKSQNKSFALKFMSQAAVAALLRQPDTTKKIGVRDAFFMSLMYDTAARDAELLHMHFQDLEPENKSVYLLGKGNKPRMVSIDDNTVTQFKRYAKLYHADGNGNRPMFYTVRHGEIGQMSDDNVARFIDKYGIEARERCSEIPVHINPHMIRRSRAMHMYQGGMPLEAIALILGHEDPETSRIYAKSDLEMKRRAMQKVKERGFDARRPDLEETAMWVGNENMIRILCGLDMK